jgi:hypothetical protein
MPLDLNPAGKRDAAVFATSQPGWGPGLDPSFGESFGMALTALSGTLLGLRVGAAKFNTVQSWLDQFQEKTGQELINPEMPSDGSTRRRLYDQLTTAYASMVSSRAFGVSLLRHSQAEVASLFATKGSEKTGKTTFEEGKALRVPLIPDALAHVECLTNQIFISGDHAIVVGMVEGVHTREGQPLLYFSRQYGGFTPLTGA